MGRRVREYDYTYPICGQDILNLGDTGPINFAEHHCPEEVFRKIDCRNEKAYKERDRSSRAPSLNERINIGLRMMDDSFDGVSYF